MTSIGSIEEIRRRQQIDERLTNDLPYYSKNALKIRTEAGEISPFILNDAQQALHEFVEKQKREMGRVRIIIPKARQEGCSTYIAARFYQKTTRQKGKSTFILSHQADTTEKLFQMVERFHKFVPEPAKMQTDTLNRRRMVFSNIESEYSVGTAGNEEIGRGSTIQYLHASECAFYPDSNGFSRGILQAVPDLENTEVFLESTSNGMEQLFYKMTMDALAGKGDYRVFFIPWFWKRTYRRDCPFDFEPTEKECNIAEVYKLDWQQIYWRRLKIESMKNDEKAFMREYPSNIDEAFISSGDSLVNSFKFMAARKSTIEDKGAPLVIGVDGNDAGGRNGIVFRRGRVIEKAYAIKDKKPMELVQIYCDIIDHNNPVKMFMDAALYTLIDRMVELGYGDVVVPVDFNDSALMEERYLNKRCEMWDDYAKFIDGEHPSCPGMVRVPDDDLFHKESVAVPPKKKTSSGLYRLEPKEKIEDDSGLKIDIGDAAALTFAYPVRREGLEQRRRVKKVEHKSSNFKSIKRRENLGGAPVKSASTTIDWPKE